MEITITKKHVCVGLFGLAFLFVCCMMYVENGKKFVIKMNPLVYTVI